MEKRIYICDKCKKEFDNENKLESYWPLEVRASSKHGSSCWTVGTSDWNDIGRKNFVKVDLCNDCKKLLIIRVDDFIENLRKEFNSQ